jgi:hypothetical protein
VLTDDGLDTATDVSVPPKATFTDTGPATPGEVELVVPPPPLHAARAKAIAPTISMETKARDIPFGVLIFPSSFVVFLDMVVRLYCGKTIRTAERIPPFSVPWT